MSEKHLSELGWKTITVKNKIKDATLPKVLTKLSGLKEEDHAGRLKVLKEIETCVADLKKEHKAVKEVAAYLEEVEKEVKKVRKETEEAGKSAKKESKEKEGKEKEEEEAGKGEVGKGKEGGKAKKSGKEGKEEEGSEADAEEEKAAKATAKQAAALKALLLGSLGKIKSAQGAASFPFVACVGKPSYGLILGSSASDKPGPKHRALLTKLTKGTKFISGVCLFEEKAHTFVVATVPGGLAAHLKKAITTFTGGSYAVRVRDAEGKVVLDGETDVIPPEEEAGQESEGEEEGTDLAGAWKKLRAELYPKIKDVLATNPPTRNEIIQLAAEASKQEKAQKFQGAIDAFEKLRPLLAGGKQAPPKAPPLPTDESLEFSKRLRALMPRLQRALKERLGDTGKMRAVAAFAQEKAGARDFAAALKSLDALEKLLAEGGLAAETTEKKEGEKEGGKESVNLMELFTARLARVIRKVKANPKIKFAPGTSEEKPLPLMLSESGVFARKKDFEKANGILDEVEDALAKGGVDESEAGETEKEADDAGTAKTTGPDDDEEEIVPGAPASPVWQTAKEKVDAQLNGLYGVLKKVGLPVLDQAASQIEKVLSNYRTKLVAALMDYDKATGEAKEKAREKALKLVGSYQSEIPKDAHVIAADENPFGVKLNVRATLGAALTRLQKQLSAV